MIYVCVSLANVFHSDIHIVISHKPFYRERLKTQGRQREGERVGERERECVCVKTV